MTSELWLRDLTAFTIQLAVIIGAGAALWRLCRIHQPTASLAFWRLLLLACLILPALQPWRTPLKSSSAATTNLLAAPGGPLLTASAIGADQPHAPRLDTTVLVVLAAGVLLRGLWLALGAWNLRRLRRAATRLEPVPAVVREAEARIGARADVYVSDRISGPITFGLIRPVVIVPPSVMTMDAALQEAIASHELLHVRRRDWLSVIGEEIVRTVFWFHPGIWWLIGRIQLSREHVVDEAVIRLTQSRDRYVEALLAVAKTGAPIALAPAPLFIRRRFLKKRVAQILQETTMTTRRLIASISVSASALAVAAVLVVRAFPLQAQTPEPAARAYAFTTASSDSVRITRGGEHLLHATMPEYPRRAIEQKIEGDVVLDVTVDDRGEVSDARVASGPEELRRAALESVLNWHYAPDAVESTTLAVALHFTVPDVKTYAFTTRPDGVEPKTGWTVEDRQNALRVKIEEAREQLATVEGGARLVRIRTERVPQDVVQQITERAGISIGEQVSRDTVRKIHDIVSSIDEHITVRFEKDQQGGLVMILLAP